MIWKAQVPGVAHAPLGIVALGTTSHVPVASSVEISFSIASQKESARGPVKASLIV